MKALIFLFTVLSICVSAYAGQPAEREFNFQDPGHEQRLLHSKPLGSTPLKSESSGDASPEKPKFKGSNPGIMILIGGIAALAIATNLWIVLGAVSLLLLILMILALNAAKRENKINKKNFNTKLLVVILFFSLLFVYGLIGLLILGLSSLIAAILGVEATNLFGALFIAGVGALWLLTKVIVHAIRMARYRRQKRKFEGERS